MLRLLCQVIAATNRADILDPALMRSGRLDRKIEFPHPTEDARAKILQIHSRKMNVAPDVNFEELARSTDDFNAAQLKAVSSPLSVFHILSNCLILHDVIASPVIKTYLSESTKVRTQHELTLFLQFLSCISCLIP